MERSKEQLLLLLLLLTATTRSNCQRANNGPPITAEELFRDTEKYYANANNAAASPPPYAPLPPTAATAAIPANRPIAWNNPTTLSQRTVPQQRIPLASEQQVPTTATATTNYYNNNELQTTAKTTANAVAAAAAAATTTNIAQTTGAEFNERASDVIAYNVLRFAHDVLGEVVRGGSYNKYEIFSPVSIMSALSLLMLGARGRSYEELSQLLGAYSDTSLTGSPSVFHREFANMLEDIQVSIGQQQLRQRQPANWRQTTAHGNIRGTSAAERNKPFEHIVKLANGLFAQQDYDLNLIYAGLSRQLYGSDLKRLDFHNNPRYASAYINNWVHNKTYGKINNIIDEDFPRDTNVVLANALYFKGFWENSFFDGATTYDDFFPDGQDHQPVKVKMMATGGVFPFYDAPEHDCRIIGMPYKGNQTTMYVIQPNQSSRSKLQSLLQSLDAFKIESMIARMEQKSAVVAFPKMHFQRSLNMKKILRKLHLNDIFVREYSDLSLIGHDGGQQTPAAGATKRGLVRVPLQRQQNFGELPLYSRANAQNDRRNGLLELLENQRIEYAQQRPDLYVEDILHKVDFEVNEQGTEAAATTITYLRRSGTSVLFRADTPFLVLIRHDPTKLVLFYGIINQPE